MTPLAPTLDQSVLFHVQRCLVSSVSAQKPLTKLALRHASTLHLSNARPLNRRVAALASPFDSDRSEPVLADAQLQQSRFVQTPGCRGVSGSELPLAGCF